MSTMVGSEKKEDYMKKYTKEAAKCPCSICLIKMVCQNLCEEYKNFWWKEDGVEDDYFVDR